MMRKPILISGFLMMLSGTAMGATLDISMNVDGRCRNKAMDVYIDGDRVAKRAKPSITRHVSAGKHVVRVKAFCGKVGNRRNIGSQTDTVRLGLKKHKSVHFSFDR